MNRTYQSYYTKCEPILNYMVGKLKLHDKDTVFEPCGGDGVFVDKILSVNDSLSVSVFELNPDAVNELNSKYGWRSNVNVRQTDTLLTPEILTRKLKFSKIIGNPPYGALVDNDIRKRLNHIYSGIYTKESYTLFLYACIQSLDNHGHLSFIIPDTFLTLHRHKRIRQYLLQTTKIDEILLFPSSFFPGVNFGYANLCIISLERDYDIERNRKNKFQVRKGYNNVEQIGDEYVPCRIYTQEDILNNVDSSFLVSDSQEIRGLINNPFHKKIGDIAYCVTGFYSGDDKHYLHPANIELKNAKKYTVASGESINMGELKQSEKINGISHNRYLVPIVKGGGKRFYKPNEWFMDWSGKAISEYRQSRKCRFQNADFYFKQGIAIPMIRSTHMTAALIDNRLFDQSVVGVFPRDSKWLLFLLGFFNSDICTKIISALNSSTNNSANYIKQIPFIVPNEQQLSEVNILVSDIISKLKDDENADIREKLYRLNVFFTSLYAD